MARISTWFRGVVIVVVALCAEGSAAARPGATTSASSLSTAAAATASFFTPHLSVRAQRAVLTWRAAGDLVLTVQFGETPALGRVISEGSPPPFGASVRGAAPLTVHRVQLDGLAMGRAYFYRATLARAGAVVSDTGVLSFETPRAYVRVQPVEIEMHKDGDHDLEASVLGQQIYDNDNEGEVYLEWNVKLRAAPGDWPWSPREKGCYPGGGAVPTSFPDSGPDLGNGSQQPHPGQDESDLQYPNIQTPDVGGGPDDWQAVGGCFAYSYDTPVEVNHATVGSGDTVALDPERYPALEWRMPLDLSGDSGVVGNAIAPDQDGDGEPDWVPAGSGPPEPCGGAPPGSHALVRIGVRGQEFDTVPGIGTTPGSLATLTRIINHDARDSDTLCFDLREEEQTLLFGVRAEDGSFQFTDWFEVTLEYR